MTPSIDRLVNAIRDSAPAPVWKQPYNILSNALVAATPDVERELRDYIRAMADSRHSRGLALTWRAAAFRVCAALETVSREQRGRAAEDREDGVGNATADFLFYNSAHDHAVILPIVERAFVELGLVREPTFPEPWPTFSQLATLHPGCVFWASRRGAPAGAIGVLVYESQEKLDRDHDLSEDLDDDWYAIARLWVVDDRPQPDDGFFVWD